MRIPLTFGQTTARSTTLNDGQCINMYPNFNNTDSKNQLSLGGTYGLKRFAETQAGEVRGLHMVGTDLYCVTGFAVYKIATGTAVATDLGDISSNSGPVWMVHNSNDQLAICDSSTLWVVTISTGALNQVVDGDFPGASSLTFQDQYGIVSEPGTGKMWNSNLNDFTAWTATDFVTAEVKPDNLKAVLSDHQEVWGFGVNTVEVFYNTGDADAVFQRVAGASQETGTAAANSVAQKENVIFWLDNNLHVKVAQGYVGSIVSTPAIHHQISKMTTVDDANGMAYTINGHTFYLLQFPTEKRAFVYDFGESIKAGLPLWHELKGRYDTEDSRWIGNCSLENNGTIYVGDWINGRIYTFDRETYTDNLQPIRRVFTTGIVYDIEERRELFHHVLELDIERGASDATGQGSDPKIMMTYSDDGGRTWSSELWESIGKIGEYQVRVRWEQLGESRNRVYKFTLTDPVRCEVVAAHVIATVGIH